MVCGWELFTCFSTRLLVLPASAAAVLLCAGVLLCVAVLFCVLLCVTALLFAKSAFVLCGVHVVVVNHCML
jgi:hypothetical protein